MKTAAELLESYLNNIRTPAVSASQFANDGVIELPWVNVRVQGPEAIEKMFTGLLVRIPDFGFRNLTYLIQTPHAVAAEYSVDALIPDTGKVYKQTYCGVLLAEDGKIKLLREALNTAVAAAAFSKD